MIDHGWTGTELLAKKMVKHGDAGALNRWYRNYVLRIEAAAAANPLTDDDRQNRDDAREELTRINRGKLEKSMRAAPAQPPAVAKPKSKKKKTCGVAGKGFRMYTNQLAGVELKKQELLAIRDAALSRACHALSEQRVAYERSKRFRTDDPDAVHEPVPAPSAPQCAKSATRWAAEQCEERSLDSKELGVKMRIDESTVRKRVAEGRLDDGYRKPGPAQKIPQVLYDAAAAKSNASQIAGAEAKPKKLATEIAVAYQRKEGGAMPDINKILKHFRQQHPELITDKAMRVDQARWDYAHYASYKEVSVLLLLLLLRCSVLFAVLCCCCFCSLTIVPIRCRSTWTTGRASSSSTATRSMHLSLIRRASRSARSPSSTRSGS